MTERLGFNDTLLFLAVGGIAAFALGVVLGDSAAYMDSAADQKPLKTTATLLKDLGMIAAGTAIVLAAIRAEGHSTVMRAVMLVLGLAVIFKMLSFGFSGGVGV